ncbi:MAG: FAD-binding oxidoreductase [Candidatus Omnitrophota bacterium]
MLVKNDPDIIKGFMEDSSGMQGGYAESVFFPENTGEVSSLLKEMNKKGIPVTVSGNGTGVTAGRIPFGGVVLSTEKLNRIIKTERLSEKSGIMSVQAGVTLRAIKNAAESEGLLYPPDPTEDTACIGGNISTNASGARGYRYGSTRRYVNRLKIVLADGKILDISRNAILAKGRTIDLSSILDERFTIKLPAYKMPHIKNAAGYYIYDDMDAIDIFVGQEGTLGVITEAGLDLIQREEQILTFFAFFGSDIDALNFVSSLRREGALSIEYFDDNSLRILRKRFLTVPKARAAVFFEKEVAKKDENETIEKVSNLLKKCNAFYDKTWLAQSPYEYEKLREIRHGLPESINEIVKKNGFPKIGTDLAVPEKAFDKMLEYYKKGLAGSRIEHAVFGHIGECHLHANMLPSSKEEYRRAKKLYAKLADKAVRLGGTVSAEHGIGKLKHSYLEKMYGCKGIREMVALKRELDPGRILGIGNIFPKELLA